MHNGKKLVCLALAFATVGPLSLSGCAKTTPTAAPSAAGSSSAAQSSSSAPKETVTLKLMTGDKTIKGLSRVQKAVNDYLQQQNTGLQIDWQTFDWDTLGTKTATMLNSGQEIDIVNTSSWIKGGGYINLSGQEKFTDLTKYVTDPQYKNVIDTIGKDFLDGTKVKGKYYGMPTNKEKAHNFGILCQTKELKKLNIDPKSIKSWDDLAKYFPQVKADGYIPVCAQGMDSPYKCLDWDAFNADNSAYAFDPNDEAKVVDPFFADKTIAFYKEMKTWHDKGYFSPDVLTVTSEETEMGSGKYFCGDWSLMPGKNVSESSSLKLDLTQIDITPVEKTNRETLGALLAIPATSKHPDEAFKFISMLYTDKKLINLMTYGVEGTDYTKKSDSVMTISPKTDFNGAGPWIMGNEFNLLLTDAQSPTLYTDMETYNKNAKVLDDLGFVYDDSSVKTEDANCTKVIEDYYKQLFYGTTKNVDATVAEFKSKIKAAGEEKLLADVQSQYDKWKASK